MSRGLYYENITIYRQSDYGHIEAERSRQQRSRPVSRTRHQLSELLQGRTKFGGMDASQMKRMKGLEDENCRLKKMYAEEELKAEIAKEIIKKSFKASPPARVGKSHPN